MFSPATAPGPLPQSASAVPSPPRAAWLQPCPRDRTSAGRRLRPSVRRQPGLPRGSGECPAAAASALPGLSVTPSSRLSGTPRPRPPPSPGPAAGPPSVLSAGPGPAPARRPLSASGRSRGGSQALLCALPALSARCPLSGPGSRSFPSSPPSLFPEGCGARPGWESPPWGAVHPSRGHLWAPGSDCLTSRGNSEDASVQRRERGELVRTQRGVFVGERRTAHRQTHLPAAL